MIYDSGEPWWNDIDRGKPVPVPLFSSSSSFPILGLLRPVTGVTKLYASNFQRSKFLFPVGWYLRIVFGILSELILSTYSFQFFLY
jgi:hypothetical protein